MALGANRDSLRSERKVRMVSEKSIFWTRTVYLRDMKGYPPSIQDAYEFPLNIRITYSNFLHLFL